MRSKCSCTTSSVFGLSVLVVLSTFASAATVENPLCTNNTAFFNPTLPPSVKVPAGFQVSVFASGLNMPTGIAFLGNSRTFQVYVLESGHGLPSPCNEQGSFGSGDFDPNNPFTPDVVVFDQNGKDRKSTRLNSSHLGISYAV